MPMWTTCTVGTLSLSCLTSTVMMTFPALWLGHSLPWLHSRIVIARDCLALKSLPQTCRYSATASILPHFRYSSTSSSALMRQPLHLLLSLFSSQFTYISCSFKYISCRHPQFSCHMHSIIKCPYWINTGTFPVSMPKMNFSHHHSNMLLYLLFKTIFPNSTFPSTASFTVNFLGTLVYTFISLPHLLFAFRLTPIWFSPPLLHLNSSC